jgi:hypothetical protein
VLEAQLRRQLRGNHDWLSEYRKWLDAVGIPAEVDEWRLILRAPSVTRVRLRA